MILAIDRKDVEFLKNVSNDSLKECLIDLHSKMKK